MHPVENILPPKGVLYNLHFLRAIAALSVVYFHATSTAGLKLDWDVGSRGVDIFFVISGFIISYIGRGSPGQFILRRIIRIVPFYWAATLFIFAAASILPKYFRSTSTDLTHLLLSMLFIPHENPISAEMMPTLVLGWSLNFEFFFYAIFAVALTLSSRRPQIISAGIITVFVLMVGIGGGGNPVLDFYARPIVFEFCYGIAVYYIYSWIAKKGADLDGSRYIKWLLVSTLVANLIIIFALEEFVGDKYPRYLVAGIPAFFIVLSALLLEARYGFVLKSRTIFNLGEASYIIYLIHPYIVFGILRLFVGTTPLDGLSIFLLIAFLLAATSAFSVTIHVFFERPFLAYLRSKWLR